MGFKLIIMEDLYQENEETLVILKRKQKVLIDNRDSMLGCLLPVLNDLKQVNYEIGMIEFSKTL